MTEQIKTVQPYPDPIALSMSGARKIRANVFGPEHEQIVYRILQLKPDWVQPINPTMSQLRAELQKAESGRNTETPTRSDRLTTRWHENWNKLVNLIPVARKLGIPYELKLQPIAHSHTARDCEEVEHAWQELSHECAVQEAMTPQERRTRLLETRMDQADSAIKLIFSKLREIVDEVNQIERTIQGMKRPNAIAAGARLVVSNNGDVA
jgi:hypothetical protein